MPSISLHPATAPNDPRPTWRRARTFTLLALLVAPWPLACSLTGPSFEQVPPSVREAVQRSEARGGTYAEPPLTRSPGALLDSASVLDRFDALERSNAELLSAVSRADERRRELERQLERSANELEQARLGTVDEREAQERLATERAEALEELVRVESNVGREGRARLAEEIAAIEAEVARAARARALELAALTDSVLANTAALSELGAELEGAAERAEVLATERQVVVDERLAGIDAALTGIDRRLTELEPTTEILADALDAADRVEARMDSFEAAAAASGLDLDDPKDPDTLGTTTPGRSERLGGPPTAVPIDPGPTTAELAALRTELVELRSTLRRVEEMTPVQSPITPPTALGAVATNDPNTALAFSWNEDGLVVVVIVALVLLALSIFGLLTERRRRHEASDRFDALEDTLADLAERLESASASAAELRAPVRNEAAETPEPSVEHEPAPVASEPAAGESRWERFVERVDHPTRATAPPAPPRGRRVRRVLDEDFLERYRQRSPSSNGTNGRH
ncbi:Chromosome partition protein Smc [Planctomycetes bacterium Pla163]|uniref:Chromosome partition protein Smc n=1 Tax=Rohdeia mirabilis TaxID=2528008 RepID=A0A518CW56_9BACT|nr:Chromosome partition protein Smc [Planctomycetes bacterium Pla163]